MKEIVMEEAYRTIEVRDGTRSLTIPVIQAVIRNMALNAAKGDKRSQRLMTDLLQTTERERKTDAEEWFTIATEYKAFWSKEIHRCKKNGLAIPKPLPHPDDVVLNTETGEYEIRGPMNEDEKDYLTLLDLKADIEMRIPDLEDKAAKTPKNKKVREELASLKSTIAKIKRSLANHPGGGRFAA